MPTQTDPHRDGGAASFVQAHSKDVIGVLHGFDRLRLHAEALAQTQHRPVIFQPSSRTTKETLARQIAERDRVRSGLIALLSCVEPCRTWFARGNRATQKLELKL